MLKFVTEGPVDQSVLVHVMAWLQTGEKLLPGPVWTQFTEAYCVNSFLPSDTYGDIELGQNSLVQVMAWYLMAPSHQLNQC